MKDTLRAPFHERKRCPGAEAFLCNMPVTHERSGALRADPGLGGLSKSAGLWGSAEITPLAQAIRWWGAAIPEAGARIRLKDVKHLQGLNCGTSTWQRKVLFLCTWQHCVSKCLVPKECCTSVVCDSARVPLAQKQKRCLENQRVQARFTASEILLLFTAPLLSHSEKVLAGWQRMPKTKDDLPSNSWWCHILAGSEKTVCTTLTNHQESKR